MAVMVAAAINAQAPDPKQADIAWVAQGEFCEPETVLPLPDDTLLVSNVCGFSVPGTGFLTLLDASGQVLDWRRLDGLDAPLGMAMLNNRLYLVDSNRLKIFSWPDYAWQETIELDTQVANDVAVAPNGTAFVTDTVANTVIEVQPDGRQSVMTGEAQFTGANGIAIHEDYVYVGGSRLWRVSLHQGQVETVGPDWIADIDGIEFEADGTVQITPVGGALIRFRGDQDIEILGGEAVSSANHGYSARLGLALIPTGFDNTVVAIRLPAEEQSSMTTAQEKMNRTYVLVHGASGGGWDWKTIDNLLSADGHTVYRPTLTGLGEREHLNSPDINLTTHIDDIVNVILFENLRDIVLVGHSYGGMVITGVMNRVPGRISHAIFLDAFAPEDGMSAQDLWGGISTQHEIVDGIVFFEWLDPDASIPRDVPQSLKTLTEPVAFDDPAARKLPVTFIAYLEPGQTEKDRSADPSWQIAQKRGWTIVTLESDHNAQRSHPEQLKVLLEDAPN